MRALEGAAVEEGAGASCGGAGAVSFFASFRGKGGGAIGFRNGPFSGAAAGSARITGVPTIG